MLYLLTLKQIPEGKINNVPNVKHERLQDSLILTELFRINFAGLPHSL